MTEAQKRAHAKDTRENVVDLRIQLRKSTDSDIIGWMGQQDNKAQYVKALIRADMKEQGVVQIEN